MEKLLSISGPRSVFDVLFFFSDAELCLLGNCYELFVHPPPSTAVQRAEIDLKVTGKTCYVPWGVGVACFGIDR